MAVVPVLLPLLWMLARIFHITLQNSPLISKKTYKLAKEAYHLLTQ